MLEFEKSIFLSLQLADYDTYSDLLEPYLAPGEEIFLTFRALRDGMVLTDRRIITVDVETVTGKKKDITLLPYSIVQAYAIETEGTLDPDTQITIWFRGLGHLRFSFASASDARQVARLLSVKTL